MKEQVRYNLVNIKTNSKLYKSVIHPILLYGIGSLVVIKTGEVRLRIHEMKTITSLTSGDGFECKLYLMMAQVFLA